MKIHSNATALSPITRRHPALSWLARCRRAIRVIATRRHLVEMDERMLADIGISRGEALQEAMRQPWDIETRIDPSRRRWGL